jgi:predicted CoA-binding protein
MNDYRDFLSTEKHYAVFGVSRNGKKMGNYVLDHLQKSGYPASGVNPKASGEEELYADLGELPQNPDAAVIAVSPDNSIGALEECEKFRIREVWMQLGTVNEDVLRHIEGRPYRVYKGRCLLLYLESAGFPHNIHRAVMRLFGKL